MKSPEEQPIFDTKAADYDKAFSNSYIGKIQRKKVQSFVTKYLDSNKSIDILEINCGTGADLPFLQNFGDVLATDASEEMLQVAQAKHGEANIEFQRWDLNLPPPFRFTFDVIFSNFGGLNCISPSRLQELNGVFAKMLKKDGIMFFTLMHTWSYVEWSYFMMRFSFRKAFRRVNRKAKFGELDIHYYTKKQLSEFFPDFEVENILPVGVILAGEYMNGIGKTFKLKDKNSDWLFPIYGADHVVYVLKKK